MNIKNMSDAEKRKKIEELKKKIEIIRSESNYAKAMQLALKLVLNGTYGAFCHRAFTVSNTNIANSITALAREVINYMLDKIENYFYDDWFKDKAIHDLLGVVYITKYEDGYYLQRKDGKLIDNWARKDDDETKGIDKCLQEYYMTSEDFVDIDIESFEWEGKTYQTVHKCFIHDFSNVTPLITTYLVDPILTSKLFDETRGVRDEPIIIYGDTDSLYISFTTLMKSVGYDGDELKFILHVNGLFVKFLFKKMLEDYAKPYGVKNLHDFELETINKSALHIKKKNYINNVVWEDGVFHEDLTHFYPKGVEIVKSSTPAFVRENIWGFIKYLFMNPGNVNIREILKIMKDLKKEFILADIEDISNTTSCSNYESKILNDQSTIEYVKGAHFSVKAAALHNYFLNKNPTYKTSIDLIRGGRIKWYYCKHDLGERFAYLRSFHPNEIIIKEGLEIDYDEQFSKTFLSIANRFIEPIGLPKINKRLSVLNSIFSSKVNGKKKITPKLVDIDDNDDDEIEIISSDDVILEEVNEMLVDDMYCNKINETETISSIIKPIEPIIEPIKPIIEPIKPNATEKLLEKYNNEINMNKILDDNNDEFWN
jgi:DNA polymerase elongation subunit (family B)